MDPHCTSGRVRVCLDPRHNHQSIPQASPVAPAGAAIPRAENAIPAFHGVTSSKGSIRGFVIRVSTAPPLASIDARSQRPGGPPRLQRGTPPHPRQGRERRSFMPDRNARRLHMPPATGGAENPARFAPFSKRRQLSTRPRPGAADALQADPVKPLIPDGRTSMETHRALMSCRTANTTPPNDQAPTRPRGTMRTQSGPRRRPTPPPGPRHPRKPPELPQEARESPRTTRKPSGPEKPAESPQSAQARPCSQVGPAFGSPETNRRPHSSTPPPGSAAAPPPDPAAAREIADRANAIPTERDARGCKDSLGRGIY